MDSNASGREEANVLGYVADSGHHFLLTYRDDQLLDAIGAVCKWADNEEVAFTWLDAVCVTKEIRETAMSVGKKNWPI